MSVLACPDEIWRTVCLFLEVNTFSSFRLVQRRFAVIGVEFIPRSITITMTKSSINRLVRLASHEVLRKRVEAIHISSWMIEDLRWESDTPFHGKEIRQIARKSVVDDDLHELERDKSHLMETLPTKFGQPVIFKEEDYLALLKVVLSQLPNLHSVAVSGLVGDEYFQQDMEWDVEYYRQMRLPPEKSLRRNKAAKIACIGSGTYVLDAILSTLGVLMQRQAKHNFALHYNCFPFGVSNKLDEFSRWQHGLECLGQLHLSLPPDLNLEQIGCNTLASAKLSSADLAEFIAAMPNLEEIDLSLVVDISTEDVFKKDNQWHRLKRVHLREVTFVRDSMLSFFKLHSNTLSVLRLEATLLDGEEIRRAWIPYFKRVQQETSIRLGSLELLSIIENSSSTDVYSNKWLEHYPCNIPIERAVRYLMCGKRTSMSNFYDPIAQHSYNWEAVSWNTILEDHDTLPTPLSLPVALNSHEMEDLCENTLEGLDGSFLGFEDVLGD